MEREQNNTLTNLFGENGESYPQMINMIEKDIAVANAKFGFIREDSFVILLMENTSKAMQIFWYEILSRAYIAAISGLFRQNSWIKGIVCAIEQKNFMQFASTLRGYIESSTDIGDALTQIPINLSEANTLIIQALEGKLEEVHLCQEMEEILIHFTHARKVKKSEQVPAYFKAKTVREYLNNYASSKAELHDCYSELCEITHPASLSVFCYIENNENILSFNVDRDQENINTFIKKYEAIFPYTFQLSTNLLIIILKTLNLFDVKSIYTPSVELINLDKIPLWTKVIKNF